MWKPSVFRDLLVRRIFVWLRATRNAGIRGPLGGACTVVSVHRRPSYKVTCSRKTCIKCINSRKLMTSYIECRLRINK